MEWIGIGIMLAVGFYLTPLVLAGIGAVFIGVVAIISAVFSSKK